MARIRIGVLTQRGLRYANPWPASKGHLVTFRGGQFPHALARLEQRARRGAARGTAQLRSRIVAASVADGDCGRYRKPLGGTADEDLVTTRRDAPAARAGVPPGQVVSASRSRSATKSSRGTAAIR